jgi:CubicO group peptidase (beta-lactamase class C family)
MGQQGALLDRLTGNIRERLVRAKVPGGIACAVAKRAHVVWAEGFGFADIEQGRPMTAETLINVASVSKTVTATVAMQLWEDGTLDLDADVSDLTGYCIRNPRFPDTPITLRQLLTHRSSIRDGPAYDASYVCGEHPEAMGDWLRDVLHPEGKRFHPEENFHVWAPGTIDPPGEPRPYSNIGYGLVGDLVARASRAPFSEVCRTRLLAPLGMERSGWFLSDVDLDHHAALYSSIPEEPAGVLEVEFVPEEEERARSAAPGSLFRHCLYSLATYPDGLLKTNAQELGAFLSLYTNRGIGSGRRLLREETLVTMLSDEHYGRALCWQGGARDDGRILWHHGGADPGVRAVITYEPAHELGILMLSNVAGPADHVQDVYRFLREAFLESGARVPHQEPRS